ncbi:GTPase domain-containing protein [Macrococcoides caseolyticum]|uniref:GTPase domain-containing protein n=1 Tax=Macrococcoides caseolyticum TaxID=69966 RepID=UPI001F3BBEE0|nr:GTPase [Macrococcus caseolyticus]MCE4956462.1 50S ribosome-binding GTPase [Macrococcus caseolyticus]
MNKHPLVRAYETFIHNRSLNKIGIIGQPDAGKSALINQLCQSNAHTSVHTDATLETTAYQYNNYGYLVDFPGVGTEEISVQKYKKIIQNERIEHYFYVFSSKIKEVDIEMIKYLSKHKKWITFIYNKVDTLVDVSGKDNQTVLMRDKNTELKVTLKPYIKTPLAYHFTSTLNGTGIDGLKGHIDSIFKSEQAAYYQRYQDVTYVDSYLNYKVNSAFPKLFTPSFKNIVLKQNFKVIERIIMTHFKIQEDDIMDRRKEWIDIDKYINEFEQLKEKDKNTLTQLMEITKIVKLIKTSFKMKSINPVTMAVTSIVEMGLSNTFPIFQAIAKYVDEMKQIAREIIEDDQKQKIKEDQTH